MIPDSPATESRAVEADTLHTFPVDVEHVGIRVAIPVIIIISGVVLYLLISKLIVPVLTMDRVETDDVNDFLSIILAAIGALAVGAIGDRLLKRFWPSGRQLIVGRHSLRLHNKNNSEIAFAFGPESVPVSTAQWRFRVRRSSPRAQSGWYMLAVQVRQGDGPHDRPITFYSFMPPKKANALPNIADFTELLPRTEIEKKNQPLRVVSEQRRLDTVEEDRLVDGAELRPSDFLLTLETISPAIARPRSAVTR